MKKLFMAVIALMMTISASAQFYIFLSDGNVIGVDSISMVAVKNGHEFVDLGLSVKWATCNVGASKPEEYGDYFAWGETQPKSTYDWWTYKYCQGYYDSLTKYCNDNTYGCEDDRTALELSDDAICANWGGSWRMPTDAELTELCEHCTWTWTSQNGVNGYQVTSKKNGKSIFLPAAGYYESKFLYSAGKSGHYWSRSLYTDKPISACELYFSVNYVRCEASSRHHGHPVRPVCP